MKYGVCADLQFAAQPGLSVLLEEGITTRLQHRSDCFDWIADTCASAHCKTLFVAGDIFDSRTEIPVEVLDVTCRAFARAAAKLNVVVIVGNHDSALKSPRLNSLQALRGTAANVVDAPVVIDGFACVPWYDDIDTFTAAVDTVSKDKEAKYLLTHILLEGLFPERGWPLGVLSPQRWKSVFLGDYHGHRSMAANVEYIGAPMQFDYRDAGRARGFLLFDGVKNAYEYVLNKGTPRFHVLKEGEPIADITKGDFVRIEVDDPDVAQAMWEDAAAMTDWIEVNCAPPTDVETQPRIKVKAADSDEDVLTKYVDHHDLDDEGVKAGLVAVGVGLMKGARQAGG